MALSLARGFTPFCSAMNQDKTHTPRQLFKKSILQGRPSFGCFINSGSPLIAEQIATLGYDWLLVDAQHSPIDPTQLQTLLTSIDARGCPSLVRVGGPDDRMGIQQALDLGSYGVMIPTVRTADDARLAVQACYFPPLGSRSIAFPIRPQLGRNVAEFLDAANDEVLLILQVETAECFQRLDEILAVPGVDAVFVGPFDLSFDLGLLKKYGYPGGLASQELKEACQRVAAACSAAGVAAGCFATGATGAEDLTKLGFNLIATGTDVGMLSAAAQADVESLKTLRQK